MEKESGIIQEIGNNLGIASNFRPDGAAVRVLEYLSRNCRFGVLL